MVHVRQQVISAPGLYCVGGVGSATASVQPIPCSVNDMLFARLW